MSDESKKLGNRYVNDLRKLEFAQQQTANAQFGKLPFFIAGLFLIVAGYWGYLNLEVSTENIIILIAASAIGGYMALNIGANDVANNMGPAVGGRVLTIGMAVLIAAVCESAGALLAGGDVVKTVSKGIIDPGSGVDVAAFRNLMLGALLAAALWINLATSLNAPVSTTHSIVGGVLGAGIAGAGFGLVNWPTMSKIAASWVISPVLGGIAAASLLFIIEVKILRVEDRLSAAKKWVPILIGLMASALVAYMAMKGLKKIWKPSGTEIATYATLALLAAWAASVPFIRKRADQLSQSKNDVYKLFHVPLVAGVSLLCFAHGANDVANAVGPLAAIVSTLTSTTVEAKVAVPFWVMLIGASGLALGLFLFGPKLINTVGEKITRLNAPRAYCVALASAVTVLLATTLGLPVSSTHIAIGAIFGVGFLREYMENPNKKRVKPAHRLNTTAKEAFQTTRYNMKRRLVRRRFVVSIAAAWVITVPASASLAAVIFYALQWLTQLAK
ncbi:MAG: inorganic phosphate transporter [Rhodobiaceae bacterium]|nr:inorganic phosphate transporter [Rhodobiaceae bacterium]